MIIAKLYTELEVIVVKILQSKKYSQNASNYARLKERLQYKGMDTMWPAI